MQSSTLPHAGCFAGSPAPRALFGRNRKPRSDHLSLAESGPKDTPPGIEGRELRAWPAALARARSLRERPPDPPFAAKAAPAAAAKAPPSQAKTKCRRKLRHWSTGGGPRNNVLRCRGPPPDTDRSATARPDCSRVQIWPAPAQTIPANAAPFPIG